ncbi:Transmembrane and TPR repeat-containing protein 3, partial [Araneus ventricosus]
MGHLW